MFQINEVVEYDQQLYRILATLPDGAVWIPLLQEGVFPSLIPIETLGEAVENGMLVRKPDPYAYLAYERPAPGSVSQQKAEQNFNLIEPIICDTDAFLPKVRSARIKQVIQATGVTKQTLYRLLMRYWQRGQTLHALLPDYKNSGGKGKTRTAKGRKLGRPRIYMPGVGAIIDEAIARLFRIAIEKHLLTDKAHSMKSAHRKFKEMYGTYYPDVPEEEMPTIWQFEHFYKREYTKADTIEKRTPALIYRKDVRPLTSTVNANVLGPGSRFEIDATIADIYLVSDKDRRIIISRPVVYLVIDVFSRLIVGIYIGLENPSYVAAMLALLNVFVDKKAFCATFGLTIDSEDWPEAGVPDAIMADRGELLGHQIVSLGRTFSVRIENAPPYRGDAKSVVERYFGTLQADFKPYAPGVVTETRVKKRGGKDYRLDAKLTKQEFTAMMLASVVYRNRYHTLEKYDRDSDMPPDLPVNPVSLWNWGLQHRTGKLRTASPDAIKMALLPRVKATLSELGVSVFGVYYTCQEVVKQGWLHRSKEIKRPQNLEAAYDPDLADQIYLFPYANSAEYWLCTLTPRSREFIGRSFRDVWLIKAQQKKALAESQLVSEAKRRETDRFIADTIAKAEKAASELEYDMPKIQRIKGIAQNRTQAREDERNERKRTAIDAKPPDKPERMTNVVPLREQPPEDDVAFPNFIDELFDD